MSSIEAQYSDRLEKTLKPLAAEIKLDLAAAVHHVGIINQVSAKAKSVKNFIQEASRMENGIPKYNRPLFEIQDQVMACIDVHSIDDVEIVVKRVLELYRSVEEKNVFNRKLCFKGKRLILHVPSDMLESDTPPFFQLHIRNFFPFSTHHK